MNVFETADLGRTLIAGLPHVAEFALIGSASYLLDAEDVDFAVMLDIGENAFDYVDQLRSKGWSLCGGDYDTEGDTWAAVRCGDVNLMVTHSRPFFDGYLLATEVCKALKLQNKEERILVCKIVRDGLTAVQAFVRQGLPVPEHLTRDV